MFLGGKNFKICDFGQKKPSDFGEDLFVFCRSPGLGRKICDFGQKKPSHFGENLCPPDLNFAPPRSREAGDAPDFVIYRIILPLLFPIYSSKPTTFRSDTLDLQIHLTRLIFIYQNITLRDYKVHSVSGSENLE